MSRKKIIGAGILIVCLLFVIVIIGPYYNFLTKTLKISPLKTLLTFGVPNSYDNQITIVILGIAGGNHDGPNLSDSISVFNYNIKNNKLLTVSLPRDIWTDTLRSKI